MKKINLMAAAILASLGVRAQAVGVQPAVRKVEAGRSWSRVQVKLDMSARKPAVVTAGIPDRIRLPGGGTCGVRG